MPRQRNEWTPATEFKVTRLKREPPKPYVPLQALALRKREDRRLQEYFKKEANVQSKGPAPAAGRLELHYFKSQRTQRTTENA